MLQFLSKCVATPVHIWLLMLTTLLVVQNLPGILESGTYWALMARISHLLAPVHFSEYGCFVRIIIVIWLCQQTETHQTNRK